MTPSERPERPDEASASEGVPEGEQVDAPVEDDSVVVDMRFTVIERADGCVHLLSEGGGMLFAHPAVSDEVWDAALEDVPDAWEIVHLPEVVTDVVPPYWHPSQGGGEPTVDGFAPDELAERQFELLASFLRAGFDRAEAMALVLELLRSEGPDL